MCQIAKVEGFNSWTALGSDCCSANTRSKSRDVVQSRRQVACKRTKSVLASRFSADYDSRSLLCSSQIESLQMRKFSLIVALFVLAACFCTSPSNAQLFVINGDFEDTSSSGVNNTASGITSDSDATPGIWFVGPANSSFELLVTNPASVGNPTNALVARENAQVGSTTPSSQSSFQFLDVSGVGGMWELSFDYRRFVYPEPGRESSTTGDVGDLSVAIYGIDDDSTPGWSAVQSTLSTDGGGPTGPGSNVPSLGGVNTTDELAFFKTSTTLDQYFTQTLVFDLGDGSQYDDLVIRLGSRLRGGGNVRDNFDNVVLTSVPEPATAMPLTVFGVATLLARRRR